MSADIDNFLLQQIKRHEGYRRFPYKDTVGKLSVAIGRNLDDVGISEQEAEYLCVNDLQTAVSNLKHAFPWIEKLSHRRRQAMVNLTFNMGITTLKQFKKFLAAMESGDYLTASKEMLDSNYAKQVGQRANELAEQIKAG